MATVFNEWHHRDIDGTDRRRGRCFGVPALATRGGLTIKTAVATSIPIGLTLSLAVSLTLGSRGLVDYQLVASLLIGTVIAIPMGVRLFHLFSDSVINRVTCTLIGLALVGLLVKATNLAYHL